MRRDLKAITTLRKIFELIEDEFARNPAFEMRVENALRKVNGETPERERPKKGSAMQIPDVYAEWNSRGSSEFNDWLKREPIETLKEIIRREDMDAARRTSKWKDPEKLAVFISDGLRARMTRGSAFLGKTQAISGTVSSGEASTGVKEVRVNSEDNSRRNASTTEEDQNSNLHSSAGILDRRPDESRVESNEGGQPEVDSVRKEVSDRGNTSNLP